MTQKTTAIFGIAVMAAVLLGGLTFAQSAVADRPGNTDPPKVVICHVPPGNPDNPQTIAVDPEEAAEHLAEHEGDSEGECGADPQCFDMEDGVSCEGGDQCTAFVCLGGVCTQQGFEPDLTPCDDGNACTLNACFTGICQSFAGIVCPLGQLCNPNTGVCEDLNGNLP